MIFSVLDAVDVALQGGVIRPAYEALSDLVAAPLRAGMILLTATFGYRMLKGNQGPGLNSTDLWWVLVKAGIVLELLLNWGTFNHWILQTVWDTQSRLAEVLAAQLNGADGLRSIIVKEATKIDSSLTWDSGTSVLSLHTAQLNSAFDAQIRKAVGMVFQIPSIFFYEWKVGLPMLGITSPISIPIPIPNLIPNIAGLIALVMTVVLFASVFVVLLLSRLGMISCLAVAPIFIALAMFEHTRSYTDAWFRGLLGFILTPMLLVVVLMVADACMGFVSHYPTSGGMVELIMPLVSYVLIYYALSKSVASVPQFASGMVGSLLANIGDGATHQLVGRLHQGVSAGVGAAKGAASGFVTGGPAGAKVGALRGAASALRRG